MSNKPPKILLIEDDPEYTQIITTLLDVLWNKPLELEHCDRLSTGLKRLTTNDVDLILLDLSLPDSSGLATFTQVRKQAPDVPTIVLSGMGGESLIVKAMQSGAQDCLIKGQVEGELLIRAISQAIGEHD